MNHYMYLLHVSHLFEHIVEYVYTVYLKKVWIRFLPQYKKLLDTVGQASVFNVHLNWPILSFAHSKLEEFVKCLMASLTTKSNSFEPNLELRVTSTRKKRPTLMRISLNDQYFIDEVKANAVMLTEGSR